MYYKDGKREVVRVLDGGIMVRVGWYYGENVGVVKVELREEEVKEWRERFKRGWNLVKVWRDSYGVWRLG